MHHSGAFFLFGRNFRLSVAIPRALPFPFLAAGFPLQSGAQYFFPKTIYRITLTFGISQKLSNFQL